MPTKSLPLMSLTSREGRAWIGRSTATGTPLAGADTPAVKQTDTLTLSGTPQAAVPATTDLWHADVQLGTGADEFALTVDGSTKRHVAALATSKVQSIALSGTPQEATHKTVAIQVLPGPWNPASPGPGIFSLQADGGANYEAYNLGAPVPDDMAIALRDAVNNGTKDVVGLILTGTTLITDNPSISIAGEAPYSHSGEITSQAMAIGLAAAIQGDVTATYDAVAVNPGGPVWAVILTARTIGAAGAHVVSNTPDGGTGFSQFQIITAVDASVQWTASAVTDTVTCVNNNTGSTDQDVVPTDNGTVPGSWTSVLSDVDGQGSSYLAWSDGVHGYYATYVGGGLNALAILARDAFNGNDGYVAVLDGMDPNKVLVSQSPAADFTITDDDPQFNGVVEVIGVAQAYVASESAGDVATAIALAFGGDPNALVVAEIAPPGRITITSLTAGVAGILTVSSTTDSVTGGSFANNHDATGADGTPATIVSVWDGLDTYATAPYTTGTLADLASELADLFDGNLEGYTESYIGGQDHLQVHHDLPPFTLTDTSSNGVSVAVVVTDAGSPLVPGAPALSYMDGTVFDVRSVSLQGKVDVIVDLVSGTSCAVQVWLLYEAPAMTWVAQGSPTAITADAVIAIDTGAASYMYVELESFAGAAVVSVGLMGKFDLLPSGAPAGR